MGEGVALSGRPTQALTHQTGHKRGLHGVLGGVAVVIIGVKQFKQAGIAMVVNTLVDALRAVLQVVTKRLRAHGIGMV